MPHLGEMLSSDNCLLLDLHSSHSNLFIVCSKSLPGNQILLFLVCPQSLIFPRQPEHLALKRSLSILGFARAGLLGSCCFCLNEPFSNEGVPHVCVATSPICSLFILTFHGQSTNFCFQDDGAGPTHQLPRTRCGEMVLPCTKE